MKNHVKILLISMLLFTAPLFAQALVLNSPNGGESFNAGQEVDISWSFSTNDNSGILIEYSLNNGDYWRVIARNLGDINSYKWIVPYLKSASSQALVRITYTNIGSEPSDVSNATFNINAAADDSYEPDNDMVEANLINVDDTLSGAVLDLDNSVDSFNVETDYYKLAADSGNLISINLTPELKAGSFNSGIDSGTTEIPTITLRDSSGNWLADAGATSFLNFPADYSGNYFVVVGSRLESPTNLAIGWYKYGISFSQTSIEMVDMLTAEVDSVYIDSIDSYIFKSTITGFSSGISIYLELIAPPGGSMTASILRQFPAAPKPAGVNEVLSFMIEVPSGFNAQIIKADIIVPYDEASLGATPESTLIAMKLNEVQNEWEDADFTLDMKNDIVTIHANHFSTYGIFSSDQVGIEVGLINNNEISLNVYPNPSNPTSRISYALSKSTFAELSIYNINGQKISTLVNRAVQSGRHDVLWNFTNLNGNSAANGIYFVQLKTPSKSLKRKIVFSR